MTDLPATAVHPKVKAGGLTASLVAVLVAAGAVFGVDLSQVGTAIAVLVAAVAPVVAGYGKRA